MDNDPSAYLESWERRPRPRPDRSGLVECALWLFICVMSAVVFMSWALGGK